jgi:hypothetical protein
LAGLTHNFYGDTNELSAAERYELRKWLTYFITTEEFDRKLPGYWFRADAWVPIGPAATESRRFAANLRDNLWPGWADPPNQRMKRIAVAWSLEEQKAQLEALT